MNAKVKTWLPQFQRKMRFFCFVLVALGFAMVESAEFGGSSATIDSFVDNYMNKVWNKFKVSFNFFDVFQKL